MSTTVPEPDFLLSPAARSGASAIGARLRRLSERIDRDAGRLYDDMGLVFEQRWFSVVNLLMMSGPLSVGELAAALHVSHASVSQIRAGLAGAGLITWDVDAANARLRRIRLTPAGQERVKTLTPLWEALAAAAIELNAESGDALAALDRLETAVSRQSLYDRVMARMASAGCD